ncbi:PKD domain-containing protein [Flavitalea sp. BT771]|uniref:PKD domain-containing protein n=1 Tax=Flavitalea sp. BT771 TaxID=3063329 RepID=UPI0026E24E68|nr:PKD domain-containing protein [Flavitalea sp. BT771]MDO6429312.1 PKD domain-containing protein [Flavitalea sp. BT771]MDV6218560.1 PKD domain-containing protein [Flavitalea sp. BT771]
MNRHILNSRVDDRAILTMIIPAVLSLLIMAWRFTNHTSCSPFTITARANRYYTGEVVRFESNIASFNTLRWNFGDNQGNDTKITSAVHSYDEPGEYTASLTVNDECTEYVRIVIIPAPHVENPRMAATFICPQSAEVGKPVQFSDTTGGARQWEWRFGETATVDATAKDPKYTYTTPGLKTVTVVINNDERQMGIGKIYVNPAPAPRRKDRANDRPIIVMQNRPAAGPAQAQQDSVKKEEPPVVKAPEISDAGFEVLLRAVANKQKTADHFSPYFCGNLNVQANLNGQMMPFTELCNKFSSLKSEKKIKKLTIQLVKNEKTNCIIALFVNLKEKEGLFNKIF